MTASAAALCARVAPRRALLWAVQANKPLGERAARLAWREGMRRWREGRPVHEQFAPF